MSANPSKATRMPSRCSGGISTDGKKSLTLVRLLMAFGFLLVSSSFSLVDLSIREAQAQLVAADNGEPKQGEPNSPVLEEDNLTKDGPNLIPVYLSERKLRSAIVNLNEDLRQLKRDFIEDASGIYMRVGRDAKIGREVAKRGRVPALASHLVAEEFAEILIKKHITERRLLSGLKAAFVKLLPLPTIKRLMAKFNSYRWLRGSHHYDLRPRFEGANELQFVQIYEMIELRARLRAADDVLTLTSDHIKRILNVIQSFLIDKEYSIDTTGSELAAMAELLPQVLQFYLNQVVYARSNVARAYEEKLACIGDIIAMADGEEDFLKLIDGIVDSIGLDIDLNAEANSLELPPTINEQIIANVERKWIPRKMLDSIKEDRELLLKHRRHTRRFLEFNGDKYDDDLANWIYQMSETIADRVYS